MSTNSSLCPSSKEKLSVIFLSPVSTKSTVATIPEVFKVKDSSIVNLLSFS